MFSCEFCEIFGGTRCFLQNTPWRLFLLCEGGVILSFNCNTSSAFQTFPRTNCLSPGRSKTDQGVGQQNLLPSLILLVWIRGAKVNGGKFLRIGPTHFENRDAWCDERAFGNLLNKVPQVPPVHKRPSSARVSSLRKCLVGLSALSARVRWVPKRDNVLDFFCPNK